MKIVMTELKCSGAQDVGGKTEMKILNWEIWGDLKMWNWTCCEGMQGKGPVHPGPLGFDRYFSLYLVQSKSLDFDH